MPSSKTLLFLFLLFQQTGFALTNQQIFENNLASQGSSNVPNTQPGGSAIGSGEATWQCTATSALGGQPVTVISKGAAQMAQTQAISQCQSNLNNQNNYKNPSCTATCSLVSNNQTYQSTPYQKPNYQSSQYQKPAYNPNGAVVSTNPANSNNSANQNTNSNSNKTSTPAPYRPTLYQPVVAQPGVSTSNNNANNSTTSPASSQSNTNTSNTSYANPYQQVMQSH